MKPDENGRTHEPSLRELCAEMDGFRILMNERDKRYEQSFVAAKENVAFALAAAKEQTAASFGASEKAIVKAEAAQNQYNASHNDLTKKMDVQYSQMLPRPEAITMLRSLEEKIDDLKKGLSDLQLTRSEGLGRQLQTQGSKENTKWVITVLIAIVSGMIGAAGAIVGILELIPKLPH